MAKQLAKLSVATLSLVGLLIRMLDDLRVWAGRTVGAMLLRVPSIWVSSEQWAAWKIPPDVAATWISNRSWKVRGNN